MVGGYNGWAYIQRSRIHVTVGDTMVGIQRSGITVGDTMTGDTMVGDTTVRIQWLEI